MKYAAIFLMLLVGCSGSEEGLVDSGSQEVQFDVPDAESPRSMPPVYPSEDPCEVVKEYRVYGKPVRIPVWCDPEPYIYKGYPSPLKRN